MRGEGGPPVSAPVLIPARTTPHRFRRCRSARGLVTIALLLLVSAGTASEPPRRKYTNVERLSLVRLAAVHADVQKLRAWRVQIPPLAGLKDYRCILHAH